MVHHSVVLVSFEVVNRFTDVEVEFGFGIFAELGLHRSSFEGCLTSAVEVHCEQDDVFETYYPRAVFSGELGNDVETSVGEFDV